MAKARKESRRDELKRLIGIADFQLKEAIKALENVSRSAEDWGALMERSSDTAVNHARLMLEQLETIRCIEMVAALKRFP